MKFRFKSKEEAITFYIESNQEYTKGEVHILYKAIVGQAPKANKSTLDILKCIDNAISSLSR